MTLNEEQMSCLLDDEFQKILEDDPVLDEIERSRYSRQTAFFELMSVMSRVFAIDGVPVSVITPAVWAYLFAIGSPYCTGEEIQPLDTDIFLHILHEGVAKMDRDMVERAAGFCERHHIDHKTAEGDLKTLIWLSFRPLEMLPQHGGASEEPRYDLDWLTHLVSVVSPMTGKTSDEVIYDTSLCECLYYVVQQARQYDYKGEIRRRNTAEYNEAVYRRTMELGRQYWEEHYQSKPVDDRPKSE